MHLNPAKHIHAYSVNTVNDDLFVVDINQRWTAKEQPLFVMAFLFHPTFHDLGKMALDNANVAHGLWFQDKNAFTLAHF